jgi:hypothetical protein
MQGAEERRLRRMSNTPQGGAIEGNAADDILMVNQGSCSPDIKDFQCRSQVVFTDSVSPEFLPGYI